MSDEERVASILGEWRARRDRGEAVDPLSVVRAHPDLAEELQEGFAALEVADLALAAPVVEVAAAALHNLGMAADAGAALAPIRPGRYRDFHPIGAGGMGIVYLTLDTELNRQVALKVVRPPTEGRSSTPNPFDITPPPEGSQASAAFRQLVERFLQEAWLTGALEHPGIVPIYELGRTPGGVPYYTMRFVKEVRTLEGELRKTRTLAERLALLDPFLRICDAIRYAHSRGVIHRDLKPANIGLGEFGEVVVLDWGLAKMRDQPDLTNSAWRAKIRDFREIRDMQTATSALGTPGYMSPEAALGEVKAVDEVSDVYSLGAILYQILTGRLPFSFETYPELLLKLRTQTPVAPSQVDSSVPEDLSRICEKALAALKARRFAGARLLADAVRAHLRESEVRSEVRAIIHEAQAAFEGTEGLEGEALLKQLDRVTGFCQRVLHHRSGHLRARRMIADCKALRRRAIEQREREIARKVREARLVLMRREYVKRQRMRVGVILTGLLLLAVVSGVFAWAMFGQRKVAREAEGRADATRAELRGARGEGDRARGDLESARAEAARARADYERASAARYAAEKDAGAARAEKDRGIASLAEENRRTEEERSARADAFAELEFEKSATKAAKEREAEALAALDRAIKELEEIEAARPDDREPVRRPARPEAPRASPRGTPSTIGLDAAIARLRSKDAAERIAAVAALVVFPGERASKALAVAIRDRDPAVRTAVIEALGKRGDEESVRALRRAIQLHSKDSATLSHLVAALGEAGDLSSVSDISAIARMKATVDESLTRAAIGALGRLRCAEAVGALLEHSEPQRVKAGGVRLAKYENTVLESLRRVTGLPFEESNTWHWWWRHAGRDWRPTPLEPPQTGREFRSDGWRFRIERPDEVRWEFSRSEGAVVRIRLRGPGDTAWVEVRAGAALEIVPRGSRPKRSEYRERCLFHAGSSTRELMENRCAEITESTFDEPSMFRGERALRHSVVGMLDGRPVRWKALCLERNYFFYAVSWCLPAGASEKLTSELDEIVRSFLFLDPKGKLSLPSKLDLRPR